MFQAAKGTPQDAEQKGPKSPLAKKSGSGSATEHSGEQKNGIAAPGTPKATAEADAEKPKAKKLGRPPGSGKAKKASLPIPPF